MTTTDAKIQRLDARIRAGRRHSRRRGFTLIEMVVAMSAGLAISAAAFLMARNASRFFQSEAGITSAQFQAVVGMTRLQADLRRVAFMSSPNVEGDSKLCGTTGGWPPGMARMQGVMIEDDVNDAPLSQAAPNNLTPDRLTIAGAFGSTEQFSVQAVSGTQIFLQNDGAMVRALAREAEGGSSIEDIFRDGRYLRILDQEGRFGYGIITAVNTVGTNVRVDVFGGPPSIPTRLTNGVCGCEGFCTGAIVNPVARMRYDLRDVSAVPQYAGLFARSGIPNNAFHRGPAEPARSELVRVELDEADVEIEETLEVLAELAVDLEFGLTEDQALLNQPPNLVRHALGAQAVYDVAAPIAGGGTPGTPERIRAIQVRFSTRAYRRDREVGLPAIGVDAGLLRFGLGGNAGFTRMRTLIADVQLPNQQRQVQ